VVKPSRDSVHSVEGTVVSSVLDATVAEHAPPRRRGRGTYLVLSPNEPLVEGAAEAFERSTQALLAGGHRHLIVDLDAVGRIDDAGVRALVRGYTTAQRLGGSFRLALRFRDRAYLCQYRRERSDDDGEQLLRFDRKSSGKKAGIESRSQLFCFGSS